MGQTFGDPLAENAHAAAEDLLVEPLIQKHDVEARASVDHQLEASAGASTYRQKQMAAQQKAEKGESSGPDRLGLQ